MPIEIYIVQLITLLIKHADEEMLERAASEIEAFLGW